MSVSAWRPSLRVPIGLAVFALAATGGCGGEATWDQKVRSGVCPDGKGTMRTAAYPARRPASVPHRATPCSGAALIGVLRAKGFYNRKSAWILVRIEDQSPRWLKVAPRSYPGIDWPKVPSVATPKPVRDVLYLDRHPLLKALCGRAVWARLPLEFDQVEPRGVKKLAVIQQPRCRTVRILGHLPVDFHLDQPVVVRVALADPRPTEGWVVIPVWLGDRAGEQVYRAARRTPAVRVPPTDRTGLPDLAFEVIERPKAGEKCIGFSVEYSVLVRNLGEAATPTAHIRLGWTGGVGDDESSPKSGWLKLDVLRPMEPGEDTVVGLHGAQWEVDSRDEIRESNEANNQLLLPDLDLVCESVETP